MVSAVQVGARALTIYQRKAFSTLLSTVQRTFRNGRGQNRDRLPTEPSDLQDYCDNLLLGH